MGGLDFYRFNPHDLRNVTGTVSSWVSFRRAATLRAREPELVESGYAACRTPVRFKWTPKGWVKVVWYYCNMGAPSDNTQVNDFTFDEQRVMQQI